MSDDGGKTFRELGEAAKHSDNHALAFDSSDPDYLLAGCDGGLYESFDLGRSWKFVANLPVTQIYKLALDNDYPFYHVIGGTQDNGTQYGPSRTGSQHGIQNSDWLVPYGADGYSCQIDPKDPRTIYVSWQNGNLLRYDRQSRELVDIKPQPAPGDPPERWNWDAPVLISPHSNTRIYYASQRLWRSDDRGDSWKPVSGDLSRNQNRYELKMMGRVWSVDALYDNGAMSWYGNITAISESPVKEGLIYVGTDDGLVQVSEDGGGSWRRISSFPGVQEKAFVNDIHASLHDPDTVVALLDNHKVGDFKPYILKSADRGRTWTSMAGDLPDRHILWSVVQDHVKADMYFVGTEFGLFFTVDGGKHWVKLLSGIPTIPVMDLAVQRREGDLVAATFGRGFYILDDYSPLRTLTPQTLQQPAQLFAVRKALRYVPSVDLGERGKAYQGGAFYTAPNPPFGALLTYYLKDSLQTAREGRRENEKRIRKEGGDVPFPGWEELRKETLESGPGIILTIRDAQGNVVRRIRGAADAGFHRVAWDLRFPPVAPVEAGESRPSSPEDVPPAGPVVPPGRYTAQLERLDEGGIRELSPAQSFEVADWENMATPPQNHETISAFQRKAADLQRRVLGASAFLRDCGRRMPVIRKALQEATQATPGMLQRAVAIDRQLSESRARLDGDRLLPRYNEPAAPSIADRVMQVSEAQRDTRYGPTQTQRLSLETAAKQYEELRPALRRMADELRKLEEEMDAAGIPYTPGRAIPQQFR